MEMRIPAEQIDWEKIDYLLCENHTNYREASRLIGVSDAYFAEIKKRSREGKKRTVNAEVLKDLATWVNVEVNELIKSEQADVPKEEPKSETIAEQIQRENLTDWEIEVIDLLRGIREELAEQRKMIEELKKPVPIVPKKTPYERAVDILGKMFDPNTTGVKFGDYVKHLHTAGIEGVEVDRLIKDNGYATTWTGHGRYKAKWIFKEASENDN